MYPLPIKDGGGIVSFAVGVDEMFLGRYRRLAGQSEDSPTSQLLDSRSKTKTQRKQSVNRTRILGHKLSFRDSSSNIVEVVYLIQLTMRTLNGSIYPAWLVEGCKYFCGRVVLRC